MSPERSEVGPSLEVEDVARVTVHREVTWTHPFRRYSDPSEARRIRVQDGHLVYLHTGYGMNRETEREAKYEAMYVSENKIFTSISNPVNFPNVKSSSL